MSQINRIIDAQRSHGLTLDDAELQDAFKHLQPINALRNDIVHYGVHERKTGAPSVTNILHAVTPDRLRDTVVTADMLDTMTSDVQKIAGILTFYFMREAMAVEVLEQLTAEQRKRPWLYTPPQQSRDQSKTQRRARKPRGRL